MRVLLIDCGFQLPDAVNVSFSSAVSAFDYDLIMWDPTRSVRNYETPFTQQYRGRPALSETDSVTFTEDLARRSREFDEFLRLGRTLVVFASPSQTAYVDTGQKETSGTGRNQKVTRIVDDRDVLSVLPFELSTAAGRGLEMEAIDDRIRGLWRDTQDSWIYRCVLESYPGEPALRVVGTDKVVASLDLRDNGAVVAVLPEPWIPAFDDEDEEDDADYDDEDDGQDDGQDVDRYAVPKALLAWLTALQPGSEEELPIWCADVQFPSEVERSGDMAEVESQMARLRGRLDDLKQEQAQDDQWKRLIASQADPLERQVQAAFEVLGFRTLEHKRGRSDLRLEFDGQRVVVEVKGVSKSAAEKHSAQLEKWVAEELADDVHAKGVLVVNGWRERPPAERESVFPHQMLAYAEAREHCLITGLQLLAMVRKAQADPSARDALAHAVIDTVGVLEGFEELGDVLVMRADVAAESP